MKIAAVFFLASLLMGCSTTHVKHFTNTEDFTDAIGGLQGKEVSVHLTDDTRINGIFQEASEDSVYLRNLRDENLDSSQSESRFTLKSIPVKKIASVDLVKVKRWKGAAEGWGIAALFLLPIVLISPAQESLLYGIGYTYAIFGPLIGIISGAIIGDREKYEYRLQVENRGKN